MNRALFLAGTLSALGVSRGRAAATGGREPCTASPGPATAIRVLLGRGLVTPLDAQSFRFGTRPYRGSAQTLADGTTVDVLDLESYLYGVVPLEMPRSWPREALMAQAILARTFATAKRDAARSYDVVASQSDQAYGGRDAEFPETTAAVDRTRGTLVAYGGAVATVSYMSCCGGHTESAADAWGGRAVPYLAGVACPYCVQSPEFRWERTVTWRDVVNALPEDFADFGPLVQIAVGETDASGRARTLHFQGPERSVDLPAKAVRNALGPSVVRSLLIHSVRVNGSQADLTITIEGSGRGHGVGLCQWGAKTLGSNGATAREILAFYFPGTNITNG
ncbi:MAG: SpoIID/LytB domain-containing protein [Candidatus Eremiobacteraeota bacterium]|nr:SpoIID/LytB domain-containing protein [Candidatus Eremiobacteraeota bacterium]